ncbi:hypothetical protein CBR_g19584 [Chara braunii]|uniref:Homing endonuclease LAGLIDADG domain-containing protein n=1 Tax=Chara braunii TaxID=69332 RepID=A0A388KYF5_CHABU|nr:hypothetical protein CBR_g19584 [Chara braunii]|eukprot:GBG75071.1 hypothetical protein CBR_g19584 [Chara braunii]
MWWKSVQLSPGRGATFGHVAPACSQLWASWRCRLHVPDLCLLEVVVRCGPDLLRRGSSMPVLASTDSVSLLPPYKAINRFYSYGDTQLLPAVASIHISGSASNSLATLDGHLEPPRISASAGRGGDVGPDRGSYSSRSTHRCYSSEMNMQSGRNGVGCCCRRPVLQTTGYDKVALIPKGSRQEACNVKGGSLLRQLARRLYSTTTRRAPQRKEDQVPAWVQRKWGLEGKDGTRGLERKGGLDEGSGVKRRLFLRKPDRERDAAPSVKAERFSRPAADVTGSSLPQRRRNEAGEWRGSHRAAKGEGFQEGWPERNGRERRGRGGKGSAFSRMRDGGGPAAMRGGKWEKYGLKIPRRREWDSQRPGPRAGPPRDGGRQETYNRRKGWTSGGGPRAFPPLSPGSNTEKDASWNSRRRLKTDGDRIAVERMDAVRTAPTGNRREEKWLARRRREEGRQRTMEQKGGVNATSPQMRMELKPVRSSFGPQWESTFKGAAWRRDIELVSEWNLLMKGVVLDVRSGVPVSGRLNKVSERLGLQETTSLTKGLLVKGEPRAALAAWNWARGMPWYIPDRELDSCLIVSLSERSGGVTEGVGEVLHALRTANMIPTVEAYEAMISMYCKKLQYPKAVEMYSHMCRNSEFQPSKNMCKSVLLACRMNGGPLDTAREVFEKMCKQGFVVSRDDLAHLVGVFGCEGKMDEAEEFVGTALSSGEESCSMKGKPDEEEILMSLLVGSGRWGEPAHAEKYFTKIEEAGFVPTWRAYAAVIEAYSRAGALQDALSARERARKEGEKLGLFAFEPLIEAYLKAGMVDAVENQLLPDILNEGISRVAVGNKLIRMYGEQAMFDKVKATYDDLVERGEELAWPTYKAMMEVYINSGMWKEARKAATTALDQRLVDPEKVYVRLISDCVRAGQWGQVLELHHEASRMMEVLPAYVTYGRKMALASLNQHVSMNDAGAQGPEGDSLSAGDTTKVLSLSDDQKHKLMGSIMGGATVEPRGSGEYVVMFEQDQSRPGAKDVIRHLHEALQDWAASRPREYEKFVEKTVATTGNESTDNEECIVKVCRKYFGFETKPSPAFRYFYCHFYDSNGQRRIPRNVGALLQPHMIAYWLMYGGRTGDGEVVLSSHGYYNASNTEKLRQLIEGLNRRAGDNILKKDSFLRVKGDAAKRLRERVKSFLIPEICA